jgi:hypothetical protein
VKLFIYSLQSCSHCDYGLHRQDSAPVLGYEIDSRGHQDSHPVATGSSFLGVEGNCIMKLITQIQLTMNVRMCGDFTPT